MEEQSRILIVDDEPFNIDYLEQELDLLGYETESAYSGREALEKVAERAPDLILLDVMMPDIDGFTVCRMLKDDRKTRLIPIIFMTSLNATEDRIKGIEAGADDFLTKPVNERELMARIKTTLKLKRAVDDEIGDLRRMGDHLAKFVPDAVKRLVSANPTSPDLQKREQDVSVMFVDISGYTRLSEKIAPEVLNLLVERYFSKFLDRIHDNDGEVSETAGDGLMAIFQDGDPKRHADKAINTALTMLEDSAALNQENTIQPMDIHIGVNSGLALVGSTKFQGRRGARWVFTADGSVTNLAARLANVAKEGELVAGPETIGRLDDRYPLESLGSERLKNIDEPVEIFRILGPPSTKRNRLDDTAVSSPPPTDRATQPRRHPIAENGGPTPNTATTTDPVSSAGPELESGNGGLPWPDDYQDLKPLIHESWDIGDDLYLNRMLSGKSGALVYAADVTSRDFGGQAILKLDRLTRHGRSEAEESERHRQAIEASPDYAARHLPSIVHTCQHDGKIAILSTIAARGLEYAHPWTECPYDRQLTSVQRLSRELLEDWNTGYAFAAGMKTPSDLLKGWLQHRLDPAQGRIHAFLTEHCGIGAHEPAFMFEGRWYPNPLAFAENAHPLPDGVQLRAATGNVHGDLHGFNVLVNSSQAEELEYYLIDLAFYVGEQFLFYDHAYFELSYLLHARDNVPLGRFKLILDALGYPGQASGPALPSGDDLGLTRILAALRQEEVDWIERHEPNRLSYLASQRLLARVATGLNFVHKRITPEARRMALLYGANSLKHYLKFHSVEWPREGRSLTLGKRDA